MFCTKGVCAFAKPSFKNITYFTLLTSWYTVAHSAVEMHSMDQYLCHSCSK